MRSSPETHQNQTRAASRARNKALRDLSKMYPEAYRELYETHAMAEGVMPRGVRRRMLEDAAQTSSVQP